MGLSDLFDDSPPVITPEKFLSLQTEPVPETFVLFFYQSAFLSSLKTKQKWKGMPPDYFLYKNIGVKRLPMGADMSVITIELLIASGVKNMIVFGTACAIQPELQGSDVCLITSAVREEGVSHHYLSYKNIIENHTDLNDTVESVLKNSSISYKKGRSYTTAAFFRETENKIAKMQKQGVLTIDMEAAALFSVAQVREINLQLFVFISDKISRGQWQFCRRDKDKEARIIKTIIDEYINK